MSKITREQIDQIYKGLIELCLCRDCLFRDFFEVYHKNVAELIDEITANMKRLEEENNYLKNHRFARLDELPDLTEKAKELVEKMALQGVALEIPVMPQNVREKLNTPVNKEEGEK